MIILLLLCIFVNEVQGNTLLLDGKVNVEGLYYIHGGESDGTCSGQTGEVDVVSVMQAEAVKWYFNQLNQQHATPVTIGFQARPTCGNSGIAAQTAIDIMQQTQNLKDDNTTRPLIGVIGPETSGEAVVVSSILSSVPKSDRILQLGVSTTAEVLSDATRYPNFARVIPNDDIQVEVMVESMKQLEWNRIAIVHENTVYGIGATNKLKERAEANGMCISSTHSIDVEHGIKIDQLSGSVETITNNRITGLVFFGSSHTANKLFQAIQSSGYSEVPVVMLSEGFNMDKSTFEITSSTNPIEKAKGSLAVSPMYHTVTEFETYWKSIFMNSSIFTTQSQTNPWLMDVFHKMTDCTLKNCKFDEQTQETVDEFFSVQPLFVQYSVIAAHVMAKLASEKYNMHCPNGNGELCQELIESFKTGDIVDNVGTLEIDFDNDFTWRPASMTGMGVHTLGTVGDIQMAQDKPNYEVFNYQQLNASGTFALVKIGELVNGILTINLDKLLDYDENNMEHMWPDVRKAQCPVTLRCDECIPMDTLYEEYIFEEGDAYVIGVNSIFRNDGVQDCGDIFTTNTYQTVEAMRFGIRKINAAHFKNLQIGFIGVSSCNSPTVIQRKIYELFKHGLQLNDGRIIELNGNVIGFVGDVGSTISISIAETLTRLEQVQISYASTSPLLSDRTRYPYFMRVVTPDDEQAHAMIEILKKLNVTYIQLVHSKGAYGDGGKEKILEAAYDSDICVKQSIEVDDDNFNSVYEKLRIYPEARIVIVFLRSHHVKPFTDEIKTRINKPGEFIFIGSEAWAKNPSVLENDPDQLMLGSITVVLEMAQDSELKTHILGLEPKPFIENPWSLLYLQEKRECYFATSFDKTKPEVCDSTNELDSKPDFVLDTWATSAYIATKSLLIGAESHFKQKCGESATAVCDHFKTDKNGLIDAIRKVKLDLEGTNDYMKVFDSNGNGNVGYRIYNIQPSEDNPLVMRYREIGRYPLEGTFTFETKLIHYPSGGFTSVCPNTQACAGCIKAPPSVDEDGAGPEDKVDAGMVALGVLFGIACLAIVVLVIVIVCIRRSLNNDNDVYLHPPALHSAGSGSGSSNPSYKRPEVIGLSFPSDIPTCMLGTQSGIFHEISPTAEMETETEQF